MFNEKGLINIDSRSDIWINQCDGPLLEFSSSIGRARLCMRAYMRVCDVTRVNGGVENCQ